MVRSTKYCGHYTTDMRFNYTASDQGVKLLIINSQHQKFFLLMAFLLGLQIWSNRSSLISILFRLVYFTCVQFRIRYFLRTFNHLLSEKVYLLHGSVS